MTGPAGAPTGKQVLDPARPDPGECCGCVHQFDGRDLVVDATDCPGDGDLATRPTCRATAVEALGGRGVNGIRVDGSGDRRDCAPGVVALLVAAGRFADAVAGRDRRLAALARRDPLGAAARATVRPGPVADLAAGTGLAAVAEGLAGVTVPPATGRPVGLPALDGGPRRW